MKSDQAAILLPQVVKALHRLNEMENTNANLQTGNLLRKMRDANGPDTQRP